MFESPSSATSGDIPAGRLWQWKPNDLETAAPQKKHEQMRCKPLGIQLENPTVNPKHRKAIEVRILTYIHTYLPTYLHTYIPTYLHTYIHTYIHTHITTTTTTDLYTHLSFIDFLGGIRRWVSCSSKPWWAVSLAFPSCPRRSPTNLPRAMVMTETETGDFHRGWGELR